MSAQTHIPILWGYVFEQTFIKNAVWLEIDNDKERWAIKGWKDNGFCLQLPVNR